MTVALDLRNGYFSIGFRQGGQWLCRKRLGLVPSRTADDYALLFSGLAADAGLAGGRADKAIVSSVVPGKAAVLKDALAAVFGTEPLSVGPGLKTGLKIRTDVPSELGSDLVCLAVAARARFPSDLIVVEAASCLTFSAVNAQGEFLGAVIAPSMEGSALVLRENSAQLPEFQIARPSRYIGRNTQQSMSSGIVNGYIGLMDGILAGIQSELGGDAAIVGSGLSDQPLASPTKGFDLYDPWLCLEGLALLAERN